MMHLMSVLLPLPLVPSRATVSPALTREALVIERGRLAHRGPSADLLRDEALLERFVGVQQADNLQ